MSEAKDIRWHGYEADLTESGRIEVPFLRDGTALSVAAEFGLRNYQVRNGVLSFDAEGHEYEVVA